MPDIFLSWGGNDVAGVDSVKAELKRLGFKPWEYRDSMAVGNNIPSAVVDGIAGCVGVVVCFSDETYEREWIQREIDFAYALYRPDLTKVDRIFPVWVGPHPNNLVPPFIKQQNIRVADLVGGKEMETFVRGISGLLGHKPPITMPAALCAMTESEASVFFEELGKGIVDLNYRELCKQIGMDDDAETLIKGWSKRYGPKIDDFSPFDTMKPLVGVVEKAVATANPARLRAKKRPIHVQWMHDKLRADNKNVMEKRTARSAWGSSQPLLVIDSVSALNRDIVARINELPESPRASVLWIPPYTLHTDQIEMSLRGSLTRVVRFDDALAHWEEGTQDRHLGLESATPVALRLWLHRMFVDMADQDEPIIDLVQSVRDDPAGVAGGAPDNLSALIATTRGASPYGAARN